MSSEWLYNQLLLRFQTFAEYSLVQAAVHEIQSGPTINCLPIDVLALVLSYVERKSVFTIMQVCKQWHLAATTKNHFWKRHIDDALNSWIVKHKIQNREHVQAIRMFDTFSSHVKETIRQQVEWIFKQDLWLHVIQKENESIIIVRRFTFVNTFLENLFSTLPVYLGWIAFRDVEPDFTPKKTGRCIYKRTAPARDVSKTHFLWLNVPSGNKLTRKALGKVIVPKFGTFEGEIIFNTKSFAFAVHGDGKWTLNDGTILEGAGVAYRDEPRFILTEQEWPLLKRQKTGGSE